MNQSREQIERKKSEMEGERGFYHSSFLLHVSKRQTKKQRNIKKQIDSTNEKERRTWILAIESSSACLSEALRNKQTNREQVRERNWEREIIVDSFTS